jgi:hypothetical protein
MCTGMGDIPRTLWLTVGDHDQPVNHKELDTSRSFGSWQGEIHVEVKLCSLPTSFAMIWGNLGAWCLSVKRVPLCSVQAW